MLTIEIKQKINGKWKLQPLSSVKGKTWSELFDDFADPFEDRIMKIVAGDHTHYYCSNDEIYDMQKDKLKPLFFFDEGKKLLIESGKEEQLNTLIPMMEDIEEVFPGTTLQKAEVTNSQI